MTSTLKAALNYAAGLDERIANAKAWAVGLKPFRDAFVSRNTILSDGQVAAIVEQAYRISDTFGLLVEVLAVTGARCSQIARLATLMMPSSCKGRSSKSRPPTSLMAAARAAGCDPNSVTPYALRHSAIVREIVAGIPIRIVAASHDTSVAMIERTYSKHVANHSDALIRRTLLDGRNGTTTTKPGPR
jgi:integrase